MDLDLNVLATFDRGSVKGGAQAQVHVAVKVHVNAYVKMGSEAAPGPEKSAGRGSEQS